MTTVINIHKDSFMFMTGVMSSLWQCHVSLLHTPSNKVLPFLPRATELHNGTSVFTMTHPLRHWSWLLFTQRAFRDWLRQCY